MAKFTVGPESGIKVGGSQAVKLGGQDIIVFHLADGFFATQAKCTHLFKSLAKGKIIDGCNIQCPLHRAEFNIKTGEVEKWANFPPGVQLLNVVRSEKALATYPVSIEDGNIVVTID